jgi:hypothetical protein
LPTIYRDTGYVLSHIIEDIKHGRTALPDIQRPFVWSTAKIRDLFDSLYRGYPVGTLMFWETGAETGTRQIGGGETDRVPQLLVVDGQQRLTSLYAVVTGEKVLTKDFLQKQIRIAFNPMDERFEVTDAAIERDAAFIADITSLWRDGYKSQIRQYFHRLDESSDEPLSHAEHDRLEERVDRVRDLRDFRFQVIELGANADEEQVAEIFVRINSEGVKLNQADFILTLMSVYWEKGRRQLEEFARACVDPAVTGPSPKNVFINPSPDQLLRAAVGLAFRRGRLRTVYSILRGKDLESGAVTPERREEQFGRLAEAQQHVVDLTHWHEFLKCLQHAGFRHGKMISSDNAVIYTYAMWLVGRVDFGLDFKTLRAVIGRWFFMVHTTGRYTSSPETAIESDLNRISRLDAPDGKSFCDELDRILAANFTGDYWDISLPNALDSTASRSPVLFAYWAALNLLDAELLFSTVRVKDLIDQGSAPRKGIERHHLFPRAHLKERGITARSQVNAIANMAFVDWPENIQISAEDPATYWPAMTQALSQERIERQGHLHALPHGWEQLDYDVFLERRRARLADVVREGFQTLWGDTDTAPTPATVTDLARLDESHTLEFKSTARVNLHTGQQDKRMEHVVAKTVCGFLNAEGGKLLIGVDDDGVAVGLGHDYKTLGKKQDRDGFELWLRQHLETQLSIQTTKMIRINFGEVDGEDVALVTVSPSGKPAFSRPVDGQAATEFWVRVGNQTKQLHGDDMVDYQDSHWS